MSKVGEFVEVNIKWKQDDLIFDSWREAEIWGDSIANDIHGRTINGYITPDIKIASALSFLLALNPEYIVHTEKSFVVRPDIKTIDSFFYKVWVTYIDYEVRTI